jgi:hypothetical protein
MSYLVSPANFIDRGPNQYCPIKFVHLTNFAGFPMNCDAFELVGGTITPNYLFTKNYPRQSRPLYILSGSILGYTIYFLSYPIHDFIKEKAKTEFHNLITDNRIPLYVSHYVGLVVINFIVLVCSLWLFELIIEKHSGTWKNGKILQYFFLVSLLANNVTKQFFWSPHFQMFNTFMPLYAIWIYTKNLSTPQSIKQTLIQGCLTGVLQLFYGSFILIIPIIILSQNNKQLDKNSLKRTLITLSGFLTPIFLWYVVLTMRNTTPYSEEMVHYREFLWIYDAMISPNKNLFKELFINLKTYAGTTAVFIFPVILFVITYWMASTRSRLYRSNLILDNKTKIIFGSVFILTILFFGLMGYYSDRLTYSSTVVLICCAGIFINKVKLSNGWITTLSLLILCWQLFLIFFEMPHFTERFYR